MLARLRSSGLQIAIDDAGSGYSGLESILQMRPEYIKVANSIVHSLHRETIKRGTLVKNVRLTGNAGEIECNTKQVKGLVLKTEFLKKA